MGLACCGSSSSSDAAPGNDSDTVQRLHEFVRSRATAAQCSETEARDERRLAKRALLDGRRKKAWHHVAQAQRADDEAAHQHLLERNAIALARRIEGAACSAEVSSLVQHTEPEPLREPLLPDAPTHVPRAPRTRVLA